MSRLAVAWTYRTGEASESTKQPTKFEATPLMVDGTLYLSTPFGRVIALDPETGHAALDVRRARSITTATGATSPIAASPPGSTRARPRPRHAGAASTSARSTRASSRSTRRRARCVAASATNGTVELRRGLHNSPYYAEEYQLTSPPAVINGMMVTGSSVADNNRTNAASGEVRAFDARTGALKWSWDPVPRDSTDPAWATWRGAMAHTTGAANAWSVIAADSARDLVFVPTGSASPDYYGGERVGDNRYANSIVALRASTGKVVWHFQTVHHDLWDYDNASPPALVTITHDGKRVDVVLQATKTGQLFVLDRDTGKPVFPVEERAVPREHHLRRTRVADAAVQHGHSAAQPAGALARQRLGPDARGSRELSRADSSAAQRRPVHAAESRRERSRVPSNIGGAHWGGLAFDPHATDRDHSRQSHRGVRPAHSARRARHRRGDDATRTGSAISTRACTARRT